jgi:polar amino acid transport system substrate-binding protein
MRKVFLGFLMILFVVSLWGKTTQETPRSSLVVNSDFPPYEFINSQGNPDGYNVELSKEVAKILNWEPEFRLKVGAGDGLASR